MPLFSWIVLVAAIAVLAAYLIRRRGAHEASMPARVAEKHIENHRHNGKEGDALPSAFVVTFQAERRSLRLEVNRATYDLVQAGMEGVLSHKADVFIAFEPNRPHTYSNLTFD